jgi:hypothetical protein
MPSTTPELTTKASMLVRSALRPVRAPGILFVTQPVGWAKSDAAPDVRSARGEHPRFVKRKLLDIVVGDSSVRQASIACGVNYGTAQRWKRRPSARF